MPNHLHGIIVIDIESRGEVPSPETKDPGITVNSAVDVINAEIIIKGAGTAPLPRTLGQIIAYFKYQSTKKINRIRKSSGTPVWQQNYYEHIIRNGELDHVREYIKLNPEMWQYDRENEQRLKAIQSLNKWQEFETKIFG